jgi:hypothetical protein
MRSLLSLPLLSRSATNCLQTVSKCSGTSGEYPDFINYELIEEEIEKEFIEDNKWIKSDDALRTMRLGRDVPVKYTASEDMHEHIIARGYESAGPICESSRRVLSSCLTFPLTLSYAHQLLFPALSSKMNVLVVGARAESSLPLLWWKDCLYNNRHLHDVTVEMMGPGLRNPSTEVAAGETGDANLKVFEWKHTEGLSFDLDPSDSPAARRTPVYPRVTLSKSHLAANIRLLHETENRLKLLQWADIFLLYNPGELCISSRFFQNFQVL